MVTHREKTAPDKIVPSSNIYDYTEIILWLQGSHTPAVQTQKKMIAQLSAKIWRVKEN